MRLGSTSETFAPDQEATMRKIANALERELRPIHYREAYGRFFVPAQPLTTLSNKTDGAEKLRQWFAESSRGIYVDSGFLYLVDWLHGGKADLLRAPVAAAVLTPEDMAACAYDCGRRHGHMQDKYGRANTRSGIADRQRRALIEWSVAKYFRDAFSAFYAPPANFDDYTQPCDHDFQLKVAGKRVLVDVKEFTRQTTSILTNTKQHVVYLFANWRENHAEMVGFVRGQETVDLPIVHTSYAPAKEVKMHDLTVAGAMVAYYNMILLGMDLNVVRKRFAERFCANKFSTAA